MDVRSTETRRLAAIMFTDMVGFSALAQSDEALALSLLEEHRELLRSAFLAHRGNEIKTIGDGFLVEFASAVAAVDCAVEIQETLERRNLGAPERKRFWVRIGLHLGDVLLRDGDIVGDGVNVAARVEPLADAGGIALTQQVFDQVYNKITYPLEHLGKIELKNIQRPLSVYRLRLVTAAEQGTSLDRPAAHAPGRRTASQQRSIAVLPFVNLSSDRDNEFLSDGISEDLLSALSAIAGLHVAARTSCFAFKGRNADVRAIGETLGVQTILEGSVQKADARLRITAQLINVTDGFRLWSQRFDREMQDVFAIQDDITQAITSALQLRLSDAGRDAPKPPTSSAEAYELCLKGRFFWNQRGIGLMKALHYFELARLDDPDYALASSGLADTYSLLSWYGLLPPGEAIPKAISAATRALQLQPTLAEAHTSLGFCTLCRTGDWQNAEAEFLRAIELNERTVPARYWLGWLHSCMGRHDAALAHCRDAVGLEPFSPIARAFLGWMYYHAGDFDEAVRELREALDQDGTFVFGRWLLGRVYLAAGRQDEALGMLKAADALANGAGWTHCVLGHALAVSGDPIGARQILDELRDTNRYGYKRAIGQAMVYVGLDDTEQALNCLDTACADRDVWTLMLAVDPVYAGLRSDARFREILWGLGLE